jgi:hypothetical protein
LKNNSKSKIEISRNNIFFPKKKKFPNMKLKKIKFLINENDPEKLNKSQISPNAAKAHTLHPPSHLK